jgi:glycosyltransferase involved in cell wall biosynthesis
MKRASEIYPDKLGTETVLLSQLQPSAAGSTPPPVSAIVITLNEAANIAGCLESLKWVKEIVVVDAQSTDDTVAQAKNFTDKIFVQPWEGYAITKAFALSHCTQDWVLWIDADERVTPELRDEILKRLQSNLPEAGFYVPRLANFLGHWMRHGGWYPGYVLRLFRRDRAAFGDQRVQEQITIKGPTGKLSSHLLHYADPTLEHYLTKLNNHTSLSAEELHRRGKKFNLLDLLFRPLWFFFRMYFLKAGFLDGIHGFVLASFSAVHMAAKYAKLWEMEKNERESG